MDKLISRQAAIDIGRNATVDTNPLHFEAHQKFIQFMEDKEISSFGRWQWSNGFNTALTAVGIDLKKLPSAHPELDEWCTDCKEYDHERHCCPRYNRVIRESLAEIADERLVPKKPYTYYSNPPYKTLLARCPNCKRPLRPGRTYRNPDLYCPRCGQAIDWSEVEE